MPRSTVQYVFEHRLLAWAENFRGGDGFLVVFGPQGEIAEIYTADATQPGRQLVSHELKERVALKHASWLFFDPFDWPEYAWMEWKFVPRSTLEQLIGDFPALSSNTDDPQELPESWHVMF